MTAGRRDRLLRLAEGHAARRGASGAGASCWRSNGLGEAADRPIRALSKGMAQKVQLLSAIAHEPDLVILDEPFSGLDPVNQQSLEDIIRGLAKRGATVVFSTHVMQHAERLCDQVVLIADGPKVFDGTVAEACAVAPRTLVLEGALGPDAAVRRAGRRRRHQRAPGGRPHAAHRRARPRRAGAGGAEGRLRPRPRHHPPRAEGAAPARRLHRADRRPAGLQEVAGA